MTRKASRAIAKVVRQHLHIHERKKEQRKGKEQIPTTDPILFHIREIYVVRKLIWIIYTQS